MNFRSMVFTNTPYFFETVATCCPAC